MAGYVGTTPRHGEIAKLDSITTSATATYTLQKGGANYSPGSANNLILSLNGVTQAPGDAFTVDGSTLTFSESLSASDVIDYIIVLGDTHLPTGVPSDGSIVGSKMSNTLFRDPIRINSATISSNITIASTERGLVAGSLTVDSGVTLTVNGELTIV